MKISVLSTALLFAASIFCLHSFGQGKARVTIKKNTGGVITEEFREIDLDSTQDMNTILKNLGVMDEFGTLGEGQQFEINIDQYNDDASYKNLQFRIDPDQAATKTAPAQPYLGVMLKDFKSEEPKDQTTGAVITEVVEASAAELSGLNVGDVITQIDKQKITSTSDVISYIKSKKPEDQVSVKIKRDGKAKTIKARLGKRTNGTSMNPFMFDNPDFPAEIAPYNFEFDLDSIMILPDMKGNGKFGDSLKICQPFAWKNDGMDMKETAFLGVTPSPESVEKGVRVQIEPESSAQSMGLQDGDIILEINKNAVNSFSELAEIIGIMKPGDEVEITYEREGKMKNITGLLGSREVSGSNDFRIFHDFKGMDEEGEYLYDYQFDMDAKDLEQHMEDMLRDLELQQDMLSDEKEKLESDLEKFRSEKKSMSIKISIAEIDEAEKQKVNSNATPKLENKNDLEFDEISFFPNPNNGLINLKFKTTSTEKIKIMVFDADGAIIYMEEKSVLIGGEYQNTIDIADQPNGLYYLQIMQNSKTYSKKIIKSE